MITDTTKFPEEGWCFWLTSFFLPMLLSMGLIGGTVCVDKTFS